MTRRRYVLLTVTVVLGAAGGLARVFTPEQTETAVDRAGGVVETTPDPVVVGLSLVVGTLLGMVLLYYLVRFYYWLWRSVEGPVARLWNVLLPESPAVRFGVGTVVMVLLFLVGPLVVLQALDVFDESDDPVESIDAENTGNVTDDEERNRTVDAVAGSSPRGRDRPPDDNTDRRRSNHLQAAHPSTVAVAVSERGCPVGSTPVQGSCSWRSSIVSRSV